LTPYLLKSNPILLDTITSDLRSPIPPPTQSDPAGHDY